MTERYEILCSSGDDREHWLELRRTGIGASEMPILLGESSWGSELSLYTDKIGVSDPDEKQSERLYWGSVLEQLVAREFSKRTGMPTVWIGELRRSAKHRWMLCTLDALVFDAGIWVPLECKTADSLFSHAWENGAPDAYITQIHQQMIVDNASHGFIACLIGGNRFVWTRIERDEVRCRRIISAGERFWNRVESRVPPDPDGTAHSRKALGVLHPEGDGSAVELDASFIDLDDERTRISAEMSAGKKRLDQINQLIQAAIGDSSSAVLPSGVCYTLNRIEKNYTVSTKYRELRRKAPKK